MSCKERRHLKIDSGEAQPKGWEEGEDVMNKTEVEGEGLGTKARLE